MRWKVPLVVALVLVLGIAALFVRWRNEPIAEVRQTAPASPSTIAATGEILGLTIGTAMAEARTKLDPLRAPGPAYQPDQKELQGRRVYWKLSGTDYDWIMV